MIFLHAMKFTKIKSRFIHKVSYLHHRDVTNKWSEFPQGVLDHPRGVLPNFQYGGGPCHYLNIMRYIVGTPNIESNIVETRIKFHDCSFFRFVSPKY